MQSWLDTLEGAGAFGPPAQRFVARFLDGALPPRGVEGLIVLASSIDRFAEDGEPADDDAFLEGAGALLAVLVIAAHPGRTRHVSEEKQHRVELDERGFFDPFAAVSAALTGDLRARKVLALELAHVEAELRGEGPISRVSRAFEDALAASRPELRVVHRFDRQLVLSDETRVDLTKAIEATDDVEVRAIVPPAVTQAAKKLVDMLPGGRLLGAAFTLDEVLPRLYPRLLGPSFELDSGVHAIPFRGEVRIALVARFPDRARFLVAGDLSRWRADPDDLLHRALSNLAESSAHARIVSDPPLHLFRTGDGLDSARLLLPGLHETLAEVLGARFVAAAPHRDVLLLARTEHADALSARAADDHARAPHRISAQRFVVSAEGIRVASTPSM